MLAKKYGFFLIVLWRGNRDPRQLPRDMLHGLYVRRHGHHGLVRPQVVWKIMSNPTFLTIELDDFIIMRRLIEEGQDYAKSALSDHDVALGRTTRKNKMWAEQMENDIGRMQGMLEKMETIFPKINP